MLSNGASLRSSDSLDSFSNFIKLKPYDFESTVRDNENTDGKVSSSAMQTKEAEKERKGEIYIGVFVENARPCLPMLRVCVDVRKMNSRMKFLTVTFFISGYII